MMYLELTKKLAALPQISRSKEALCRNVEKVGANVAAETGNASESHPYKQL